VDSARTAASYGRFSDIKEVEMKRNLWFASIVAGLAAAWSAPAVASTEPGAGTEVPDTATSVPVGPLELSFDKTAVAEGFWQGTVDGDISGTLTTVLTDVQVNEEIWDVRFDWIIIAGDQSFVADLSGTLNNETGAVEMDGTVVLGYLLGAEVHEEGQLVDPATLQFTGSIQLTPAEA
jgi:hypothetical protein